MADNVEKKKIIIEAEAHGFEKVESKVKDIEKTIKKLERENAKSQKILNEGHASGRGQAMRINAINKRKANMGRPQRYLDKRNVGNLSSVASRASISKVKSKDAFAVRGITPELKKLRTEYSALEKPLAKTASVLSKKYGLKETSGYAGKIQEPFGATKFEKDREVKYEASFKALEAEEAERLKVTRAYRKQYQDMKSSRINRKVNSQFEKSPEFKDMNSYYKSLEKTSLKDATIESQRKINKAKAEEAEEARKAKEIESNYVKSKRRMSAYAKSGRASKRKFDKNNIAPLSAFEQIIGADPKRKNNWWSAGIGAGLKNVDRGFEKVANSAMMAVGQLTMVGGAFMMLTMSGAMAFKNIMAIGDALAVVEKEFLTSAGVRSQMIRSGNVRDFDTVVKKEMAISGRNTYQSGAFLGRAGNTLRNYGGAVNSKSLENLMVGAHGLAGLQGIESDVAMDKILDLAKSGKGKDATKLGLQELRLTKNMNENLEIIASEMLKDPIASTILKRGTIGASMNRIKGSFGQLGGNVMGKHQGMIHSTFQRISDNIFNAFNSAESRDIFARVFKNFEIVTTDLLTQENIQGAINGLAQWSAELVNLGGWVLKGTMWFLQNSDTVLKWAERAVWFFGAFQVMKIATGFIQFAQGVIQMVGWAKTLYTAITGFSALKMAGTGLGGLLARGGLGALLKGGAVGAGGLLAGALTNPVVLGGLAVGGAGYLGYKWYQNKKTEADAVKGGGVNAYNQFGARTNGYLTTSLGATINPMQKNPQVDYHDTPTATALVGGSYLKLSDMSQILVAPNGFTITKDVSAETQSILDY